MIRITTLIENCAGEHLALKHEHGISFFIEAHGHTLVFDTGQSGAFLENARRLRLDPGKAEFVVLSHGHYDHSGGFRALAELPGSRTVVVGKGFFEDKYAEQNGGYEFLGNDFNRDFLADNGIPCMEICEPSRGLVAGVHVLGFFPRIHPDEKVNPRFRLLRGTEFVQDTFEDEILVAIESNDGMIVLLGCAHPGLKNMIDAVKARFGRPIRAVLGGTHLVEASESGVEASIDFLAKEKIRTIGVSHCTGPSAMKRLEDSEKAYFHNRTGSSLIIPE